MATDISDIIDSVWADGPGSVPYEPPKPRIREEFGKSLQSIIDAIRALLGLSIQWKASVRAAYTSNITLASFTNGATVGGLTWATGQRFAAIGQSAGSANGIYIIQAGAPVRATDADAGSEILGMAFFVTEGTEAGKAYVCTTTGVITVGSTALSFVLIFDTSSLNTLITGLTTRVTALEKKSTIQQLIDWLNDPLKSIGIGYMGDSLTWGLKATGSLADSPRAHALADPRNTVLASVSPSWANLLTDLLRATFCNGTLVQQLDGGGKPTGVASARKIFIIDPSINSAFRYFNTVTDTDIAKSAVDSGLTASGHYLILHQGINAALQFDFWGNDLSLLYSRYSSNVANQIAVSIHGGAETNYVVGGASQFSVEIPLSFGTGGKHTVRVRNLGPDPFRLEAVKHNRLLYVVNQGIIGTNTTEWLPTGSLLNDGIITQPLNFVFGQLGTNNRSTTPPPIIRSDLRVIGAALATANMAFILMAPPMALDVSGTYDTSLVARQVTAAAADLGVSLIDNYAASIPSNSGSTELLAPDLLHQCDAGQWQTFANIAKAIGLGNVNQPSQFPYTVAGLPDATKTRRNVFVTNETGGPVPAFSDGTNWLRMTDRAIVSA